jgi:hypothetical protein
MPGKKAECLKNKQGFLGNPVLVYVVYLFQVIEGIHTRIDSSFF